MAAAALGRVFRRIQTFTPINRHISTTQSLGGTFYFIGVLFYMYLMQIWNTLNKCLISNFLSWNAMFVNILIMHITYQEE